MKGNLCHKTSKESLDEEIGSASANYHSWSFLWAADLFVNETYVNVAKELTYLVVSST